MGRWRRGGVATLVVACSVLVLGAAVQPQRVAGWLGMPVEARDLVSVPPLAIADCLQQTVDSVRLQPWGHGLIRRILSHRDSAHARDCIERVGDQVAIRTEMIRLVGLRTAIPEYNDEQRFALRGGTRFGPRVAIFASPNLDGFRAEAQVVEHGSRGILAAVVYVDTSKSFEGNGQYVRYNRLGLDAGLNCVWLRSSGGGAWAARVTRGQALDDDGVDWGCAESNDETALAVSRTDYAGAFAFTDIPPAARFEFDQGGEPLLGVKCLAGWCTIGPSQTGSALPAFTPTRLGATTMPALGVPRALAEVPGWHDEQVLANFDANGDAIPGTVRATLFPVSAAYAPTPVIGGPPQRFAYLVLHDRLEGTRYADWGLASGVNEISLVAIPGPPHYAVIVKNALGERRWTNVLRHPHVDAAVPPTARFRWMSLDDGIWFGCGQGCCRADGLY